MNGTVFAGAITVFVFPLSSLTGRTVEKPNQDYIMTCVFIVHSTIQLCAESLHQITIDVMRKARPS